MTLENRIGIRPLPTVEGEPNAASEVVQALTHYKDIGDELFDKACDLVDIFSTKYRVQVHPLGDRTGHKLTILVPTDYYQKDKNEHYWNYFEGGGKKFRISVVDKEGKGFVKVSPSDNPLNYDVPGIFDSVREFLSQDLEMELQQHKGLGKWDYICLDDLRIKLPLLLPKEVKREGLPDYLRILKDLFGKEVKFRAGLEEGEWEAKYKDGETVIVRKPEDIDNRFSVVRFENERDSSLAFFSKSKDGQVSLDMIRNRINSTTILSLNCLSMSGDENLTMEVFKGGRHVLSFLNSKAKVFGMKEDGMVIYYGSRKILIRPSEENPFEGVLLDGFSGDERILPWQCGVSLKGEIFIAPFPNENIFEGLMIGVYKEPVLPGQFMPDLELSLIAPRRISKKELVGEALFIPNHFKSRVIV
ncbi:MAG: hypothetical protein V1858_04695 [Candidatus Gottesmanbacteria bacterium]